MTLSHPQLLRQQGFIDGQWVDASTEQWFVVKNPYDQSVIGQLPDMGRDEVKAAIAAAKHAFPAWRDMDPNERKEILERWLQLINEHIEDLCVLLTSEQGKPIAQAKGEYQFLNDRLSFYINESLRIHGQTLQTPGPGTEVFVFRQPYGVCAAVSPWNFPAMLMAGKMMLALAAGNTFVGKPPEDTPLSALALTYLAERAGMPKGVINMVVAQDPKPIGDEFTTNPAVRRFSFTGSTPVGKLLYSQCASTLKSVALECGGNSPFIVFEDADLEKAVDQGAALKFSNCGQVCINVNRFLVHESVADRFVSLFVAAAQAQRLGSGLAPETTMGPLINQKGIDKVDRLVQQAVAKGAKLKTGGQRSQVGQLFYEPTVLTNMSSEMDMYHEEIFGPVAPIYTFKTEAEAIRIANDTEYGLAAYFYTQDLARVFRVSRALESGSVGVNTTSFNGGPFGGYKESGVGREQGRVDVLDEWCEVKTVSLNTNDDKGDR